MGTCGVLPRSNLSHRSGFGRFLELSRWRTFWHFRGMVHRCHEIRYNGTGAVPRHCQARFCRVQHYDRWMSQGGCKGLVPLPFGIHRRVNHHGFASFVVSGAFDSACAYLAYCRSTNSVGRILTWCNIGFPTALLRGMYNTWLKWFLRHGRKTERAHLDRIDSILLELLFWQGQLLDGAGWGRFCLHTSTSQVIAEAVDDLLFCRASQTLTKWT